MMDVFHTTHCIQCVMAIHCDIQGCPMGNMSPNVCQIWDGAGPKIPWASLMILNKTAISDPTGHPSPHSSLHKPVWWWFVNFTMTPVWWPYLVTVHGCPTGNVSCNVCQIRDGTGPKTPWTSLMILCRTAISNPTGHHQPTWFTPYTGMIAVGWWWFANPTKTPVWWHADPDGGSHSLKVMLLQSDDMPSYHWSRSTAPQMQVKQWNFDEPKLEGWYIFWK